MSQKNRSHSMLVETLEARQMMSVVAPVSAPSLLANPVVSMDGGNIRVMGSQYADTIKVMAGDTRAGFQTKVTVNGVDFKFNGVPESITVDGQGGDDIITAKVNAGGSVFGDYRISIAGGEGDDSVTVDSDRVVYTNLGEGNNFFNANFDNLEVPGQVVFAGKGSNYIIGSPGNDQVCLSGGYNTVFTGAGDDYVSSWSSMNDWNYIDLGDGNDQTTLSSGNNTIIGGAGNDIVTDYGGCYGGFSGTTYYNGGSGWNSFNHTRWTHEILEDVQQVDQFEPWFGGGKG